VARWQRQQAEEGAELTARLAAFAAKPPPETWGRRKAAQAVITGLRARLADRQARLDAIAAQQASQAAVRHTLIEAVRRMAPWSGTASSLLTLVPGVAPDATRLSRLLVLLADDLAAAGVLVERRRQAGTGQRVLTLLADGADARPGWGHAVPTACGEA
jgi:hypothetical protein